MLLCYVDETTYGSFHGFAALLVDEYATKRLTTSLNGIVHQASVDYGIPGRPRSTPIQCFTDERLGAPSATAQESGSLQDR